MAIHDFVAVAGAKESQRRPGSTATYQCSYCPKLFKRSEHCSRHQLSHTNEKPFACRYCQRAYARRDLLRRHEKTLHADQYEEVRPSDRLRKTKKAKYTHDTDNVENTDHARDAIISRGAEKSDAHSVRAVSPVPTASGTMGPNPSISNTAARSEPPVPISSLSSTAIGALPQDTSQYRSEDVHSMPAITASVDFNVNPLTTPVSLVSSANERPQHNPPDLSVPVAVEERRQLSQNMLAPSVLPLPQVISSSAGDTDDTGTYFDFLDFDLAMTGVSDEFFFHQLPQQQDLSLGAPNVPNFDLSDLTQASGLTVDTVSSTSPDSFSDKSDRVLLTKVLREKSENPPRLIVDDADFARLCADTRQRLQDATFELPLRGRRELQHFLNGYFDCFHRHLPILHLPSIRMADTPGPLILAICTIGALYRLERSRAHKLFSVTSSVLRGEVVQNTTSPASSLDSEPQNDGVILPPLWVMQTRILLSLFAMLGNNIALRAAELNQMGSFIIDYRLRRARLPRASKPSQTRWQEWVEIESTKRYLSAVFICCSLYVVVYDLAPGFGLTHDLDFELLEEEKLWTASTAEDWQALRSSKADFSTITIREVMKDMLAGTDEREPRTPYYVSGFTALIVIHAVNCYAQNLQHVADFGVSSAFESSVIDSHGIQSAALASFARCRQVLRLARPEGVESVWNDPEGPLLLNCEATLRVAYTRLFLYRVMPDSMVLLSSCSEENRRLLVKLVRTRKERGALITKAMASMCEAFTVPAKAGYLLVQKTAAISWSVEHAIAGWGCVILLSHWIHSLQMDVANCPADPAEQEILNQVKDALETMDYELSGDGSLAAAVVRSWAPLLVDVWVWGITTKMGSVLVDLAEVYQADWNDYLRARPLI